MTRKHLADRQFFASKAKRPEREWTIVIIPKPGTWYDFANAETGTYGQCMMKADGTWHQEPREGATILAHRGVKP